MCPTNRDDDAVFVSGNDNNCLTPLVRIYTSQNPSLPTRIHLIKSYRNWFSSRCAFHFIRLFDVFACVRLQNRQRLQIITRISTWTTTKTSTQRCGVFSVFGYRLGMKLAGCVLLLIKMTFDSAVQRSKRQIDSTFCQRICRITFCGRCLMWFRPLESFTFRNVCLFAEGDFQNGNIFYVYRPLVLWVQPTKEEKLDASHTHTHTVSAKIHVCKSLMR